MERDEHIYAYVMQELEDDIKDEALWIKAYAVAEGWDQKIKPIYMKYRVEHYKEKFSAIDVDYTTLDNEDIKMYIENDFDKYYWVEKIFEWADENEIPNYEQYNDERLFNDIVSVGIPRNKEKLLSLSRLILFSGAIPQEDNYGRKCLIDSEFGIREIPREINKLTNLVNLELWIDKSCDIGHFTSLNSLKINGCIQSSLENIGHLKNLSKLVLNSSPFCFLDLPKEIGNLTNLTSLKIFSSNVRNELPKEIGNLTNLSELVIDIYQSRVELPEEIGNLTNLTHLEIFSYGNFSLPNELSNLKGLISFKINNMYHIDDSYKYGIGESGFSEFPKIIGNLTNLSELFINCKDLKRLPKEIGNLTNLTSLIISSCDALAELPKEIGDLANLSEIVIECYNLERLPKEIGNLTNLTSLAIRSYELPELPKEIGNLTNLTSLEISCCKLTELPQEVLSLQKKIKNKK